MGYTVQIIHVILCFRVDYHISFVKMRALTLIAQTHARRKIVLEAEQNRGADLEGVGVAVDIFKNKTLP